LYFNQEGQKKRPSDHDAHRRVCFGCFSRGLCHAQDSNARCSHSVWGREPRTPGVLLCHADFAHHPRNLHRVSRAPNVSFCDQRRLRDSCEMGAGDIPDLVLRICDWRPRVFFPVRLVASATGGLARYAPIRQIRPMSSRAPNKKARPTGLALRELIIRPKSYCTTTTPFMPVRKWAGKLQRKGYSPGSVGALKVTSSLCFGPSSL